MYVLLLVSTLKLAAHLDHQKIAATDTVIDFRSMADLSLQSWGSDVMIDNEIQMFPFTTSSKNIWVTSTKTMIRCEVCTSNCCGCSYIKAPVLMPFELERFKWQCSETEPGYYRMNRKSDGTCVFLGIGNRCAVYEDRPVECRLFPWILSWKDGKLTLKLSQGCDQREFAEKPKLDERLVSIPVEWWESFEKLTE